MSSRSRESDKGPSQRQLRVGELIRKSLAEIFIRTDIRDDDLKGVILSVSQVSVSPDARNAVAYIFPMGGTDREQSQEKAVAALNRHAKFLRGELAPKVNLKFMPQIKFALDVSYDYAQKIDAVLNSPEVKRDLKRDGQS